MMLKQKKFTKKMIPSKILFGHLQKYMGLVIIIFPLLLTTGEAFINRRIAWWYLRLEEVESKIEAIKNKKHTSFEPRLLDLYTKDAARCREMIELLKKNIPSQQQTHTIESVNTHIQQSLIPIYSLRLLEIIAENVGKESVRNDARNFYFHMLKDFLQSQKSSLNNISQENFPFQPLTNDEADLLAAELTIGSFMDSYEPLYKEIVTSIENEIMSHSKKDTELIEIENLASIVQEKALTKCTKINKPTEIHSAFLKSGTWKMISRKLLQSIIFINDIHRYLDEAGIISTANDEFYYLKNPLPLDKIIFSKKAERIISEIEEKNITVGENEQEFPFSIPNFEKISKKIDNKRRKLLGNIVGNENKDFFQKSTDLLMDVVTNFFKPLEKSIEACKKNECASGHQIEQAQKKISILQEYAIKYVDTSASFLEWASKTRSFDPKSLLEDYNYFTERSITYMNFIRSLTEKSSTVAFFNNAELHLKFVVATKKNQKVLTILQNIQLPEKTIYPTLNPSTIEALKKCKSQLAETSNRVQRDINTMLATFQNRIQEQTKKHQIKNIKLEAGIAQYDMDQLVNILKEYTSYYSTLNYGEIALRRYAEAYKAIESPKDEGEIETRSHAFRQGALIPLIDGFDIERLKNEYTTKQLVKKEIRNLMSKIHATGVFYRQNGFSVSHLFSQEDAAKISDMLEKQTQITVADWTMNENNFEEIDKKAIKKLIHASQKQDWKLSQNGTFLSSEKTNVLLEHEGIRFTLPGIWIEETIDEHLSQRNIVKSFKSRDGSSSIFVAKIPLEGNLILSEHSALWHTKLGSKVVKSGLKQIGNFEYHWSLARDPKNRVRESFTLKIAPNEAIIISGQSPKDRYNFFQKKMEMVLQSLEHISPLQKLK